MRRIIGPILGLLGILAVISLIAGAAYSAGLSAAGAVVVPGGTGVVPAVGYGYYGVPWLGFGFGFGHFLGFLLVLFLFVAILRFAFGAGRRGRWHGYGYGPGWGPGYGRGPRGWGSEPADGEADRHATDDPREAWIRSRLEEWHRTAHAAGDAAPGVDTAGRASSGPTEPPAAV